MKFDNGDAFTALASQTGKFVVVDFWADWCGPCKAMSPVLDSLAEELDDELVVVKIDVDQNPSLAGEFSVMSVPTVLVFDASGPVMHQVGAFTKTRFLEKLDEVRNW